MALPQLSKVQTDKYNGHTPKSLVLVGGQAILCEEYSVTINNKDEVSSCQIRIPLDNIDSSVFAEKSISDGHFDVEVWSGYVRDNESPDEQLLDISQKILAKQKQDYFTKRFVGYVVQPEWEYGDRRYLNLSCADWTNLLREARFTAEKTEDGSCECRAVAQTIQKHFKNKKDGTFGIKVSIDDYIGKKFLGTIDSSKKSTKRTYNAYGKNLYEIIQDVARLLDYKIVVEGRHIQLKKPIKNPLIWPLYYGDREGQKQGDTAIGQYFKNLQFRYGMKGRSGKGNILVKVTGKDVDKSGNKKQIVVYYPDESHFAGAEETKTIHINVSGNIKQAEARNIARNKYNQEAKNMITGTIELPFANNFMEVGHGVTFVFEGKNKELSFLNGIWFAINSISETFGMSGYTQTVEFESDEALENAPEGKVAPKKTVQGKKK